MKKEEKKWLEKVVGLGCIVCRTKLGIYDSPACAHHIRTGQGMSQRASHYEAIPLCHRHHQGEDGIHRLGTRTWQAHYGSETELLEQTIKILKGSQ